ncbi:hypothetical protein Riv7116_6626 [Rivularia sp. PCC 7116]|uniref:hypothetical protein n=1 Tax=Rivularia sp. PCC 7116 TaxID=373994 RepID=UPI00029F4BEE|nr:hypothetical protein [Rivularia sp. PCC 7116]AFY58951.1 hypothetical protein Riv7116_6626 [Rivularia sp. PCC 7116]
MLTAQIIEAFSQRISWSTMRVILKICDLPVGRGWEQTIKKLTDEESVNNDISAKIERLKNCYENHLLVNDKAFKIYQLERKNIDKLIAAFRKYKAADTAFHQTYPYPLSDDNLKELDFTQKLVEIRNTEDGLAVIFCTKRLFTERSQINTEQLNDWTRKDLADYDKIIGIKEHYRQFFDVVLLSKKRNTIEIRVDITGSLSLEDKSKAFFQTIQQFNTLSENIALVKTPLQQSINFFSLIDNLYESDEGKVVELAFITDEGSTKSEKMRKGSIDLRNETYHHAGKKAVHHITSYRLAISWNIQISQGINSQPELLLPGRAQILSNQTQYLDEVCILNCSSLDDYEFVVEKIFTYLE